MSSREVKPKGKRKAESDKPKKDKPATGGKVKPRKEKKQKSTDEFEYDILKGSLTEQVAAQMSKPHKKQTWVLSETEGKALADKFTAQIMGVTVGNSTVSDALEHHENEDTSPTLTTIRADVNRCLVAHQKELLQLMKCD